MAKNDLIGGSIWEEYSKKVSDRMNNPVNRGEITDEEAEAMGAKLVVADYGAESCGDAVRLYWAVDPDSNVIKASKFKSFGCGTAIASSDMMAELCIGKTVNQAVKITNIDVEHALRDTPDVPAVPPQKMHCSVMAYDVIKKAASIYNGVEMASFEEETIVCECARVSLATLKEVIRLNDLKTIEQITDYTKAGGFCKSCIKPGGHEVREHYLVDILRDVRAEMEKEHLKQDVLSDDFSTMSPVRKFKAVEEALDTHIRSSLMADGGNVEVLDLKDNPPFTDIYIRYLGSCSGCGSADGTLMMIDSLLKRELHESIRVLAV